MDARYAPILLLLGLIMSMYVREAYLALRGGSIDTFDRWMLALYFVIIGACTSVVLAFGVYGVLNSVTC